MMHVVLLLYTCFVSRSRADAPSQAGIYLLSENVLLGKNQRGFTSSVDLCHSVALEFARFVQPSKSSCGSCSWNKEDSIWSRWFPWKWELFFSVFDESGCDVGAWLIRLLACTSRTVGCGEVPWTGVSWVHVAATSWPIFHLLRVISAMKETQGCVCSHGWTCAFGDICTSQQELLSNSGLLGLIRSLQHLLQRVRGHARISPKLKSHADQLFRQSQLWWESNRGWHPAGIMAAFWQGLSQLHWHLRHGACGQGYMSFRTRHPDPYAYHVCLPLRAAAAHELEASVHWVQVFGSWFDADVATHLFRSAIAENCTIIDVGASFGTVAFLLAMVGFHVVAIEPQDLSFDALQAGTYQFTSENESRVFALQAAVGVEPRPAMFERSPTERLEETSVDFTEESDEYDVWSDGLDSLVAGVVDHDDICGIKIDVEGGEYRVLKGAPLALAKASQVIFEVRARMDRSMGAPSPRALFDLLVSAGFRAYYMQRMTAGGGLPMTVELRHVDLGRACAADSWELYNATECANALGGPIGDVVARRNAYATSEGLPWVSVSHAGYRLFRW